MKILITGCGRGGTNLVTELVRAFNIVKFTSQVEDRDFFKYKILPQNYGTKLATENKGFTETTIDRVMEVNPDLKVIFATRHPLDVVLSKIIRGQPKSKGGDNTTEKEAPDGNPEGAINAIQHMFKIYEILSKSYSKRIVQIKMEEVISHPNRVLDKLSIFLSVEIPESAHLFYENNRNVYQQKRYGKELDKNQIDLWKNINTVYNGFFKDNVQILEKSRSVLMPVIEELGY